MTRLNVKDARCEALFASELQRSDAPTPEALAEAIRNAVRQFGVAGCAGRMAQEFGDQPEAAASRMRWIRQLISRYPRGPEAWRPGPGCYPRAAPPAAGSAQRAA
jgi:hypothetical protein